jgi:hypothetical protein
LVDEREDVASPDDVVGLVDQHRQVGAVGARRQLVSTSDGREEDKPASLERREGGSFSNLQVTDF